MNEDGNMNITADTANKASELRPDIDLNDPKLGLKIAAERLSIVRYVFLVQIEDGIASAAQRASLEYADAVLIGWPETDSPEVADLDDAQLKIVREHMGDISTAFNPQFLIDGLQVLDTDYVRFGFTHPTKPAVITGQKKADEGEVTQFRYLLMPIRFGI